MADPLSSPSSTEHGTANLARRRGPPAAASASASSHAAAAAATAAPTRKGLTAGEYVVFIDDELGRGHFSRVYAATRAATPAPPGKEEFAAKYTELRSAEEHDRFKEEANTIVRIHEKCDVPYVTRLVKRFIARGTDKTSVPKGISIFEICRGPNLHKLLLRHGPLPSKIVQRFFAQMVEALVCTHACDVVHRDIKPENFLLSSPDVQRASVVLIDFGFAVRHEGRDACGSPMFMSPEIVQGNVHALPTDVYSLGVTLLCMIFGLAPVAGESDGRDEGGDDDAPGSNGRARRHRGDGGGVTLRMQHPPRGQIDVPFVRQALTESNPFFALRPLIEQCIDEDARRRPTAMQLRADSWVREAGVVQARRLNQSGVMMADGDGSDTSSSSAAVAALGIGNGGLPSPIAVRGALSAVEAAAAATAAALASDERVLVSAPHLAASASEAMLAGADPAVAGSAHRLDSTATKHNSNNSATTAAGNASSSSEIVDHASSCRLRGREAAADAAALSECPHDAFNRRVHALFSVCNTHRVPAMRAAVCLRVAQILFAAAASVSEPESTTAVVVAAAVPGGNGASAGPNGSRTAPPRPHENPMLVEYLHWLGSQLSSMTNVLSQHDPLPDSDAAIAMGIQTLALSALRARALGLTQCTYGGCGEVLGYVRLTLRELAHYSELDSLRKRLDALA